MNVEYNDKCDFPFKNPLGGNVLRFIQQTGNASFEFELQNKPKRAVLTVTHIIFANPGDIGESIVTFELNSKIIEKDKSFVFEKADPELKIDVSDSLVSGMNKLKAVFTGGRIRWWLQSMELRVYYEDKGVWEKEKAKAAMIWAGRNF